MSPLTKKELAERLGVSVRTVTNWVQEGCPTVQHDGDVRFVEADVRRWAAASRRSVGNDGAGPGGAPGSVPGSSPRPEPGSGPGPGSTPGPGQGRAAPELFREGNTREARERARLAKDLWTAKQREHEHHQEKNLSTLDLGERIRQARTSEELTRLDLEVAGLVASGHMKAQRGATLRQLLAQAHRAMLAREAHAAEHSTTVVVTKKARELARLFDHLGNGWRRRWLLEAAEQHARQDDLELPGWDHDMTQVVAGLGLDGFGNPVSETWPEYLPAPAVPPAKVIAPTPYPDEEVGP